MSIAVMALAALAFALGLGLAVAARIFAVEVDPRIEKITDLLPGANCGGCGYAGCSDLAKAIVEGKVAVDACPVGSAEMAAKVAEIMGVEFGGSGVRKVAIVLCNGDDQVASKKFYYNGKYKQARKHCEKAIKFNHSNWEAHYYLGLTMQKKREYAIAVEALGVSLKYSPENRFVRSELHLAIGYSWEKLGNAKKAGTEYSLAIQYNPENQEAIEARNRMKVDKTMKNWGHKKKTRL